MEKSARLLYWRLSKKVLLQRKYMLHECWDIQHDVKTEHSAISEILKMARKYSINKFGLIHVNPNWSKDDEAKVSLSLKEFTNARLLNDGDVINL